MRTIRIRKGKPYLFSDVQSWGGKGDNLLKLSEVFNVPPGFIVSAESVEEWFRKKGIEEFVNEALKNPDDEKAYQQIREKILSVPFNDEDVSVLEQEFSFLSPPVFVRSGSPDEDGVKNSFAGQHDSIGGVTDFNGFLTASKEVCASLYNPRAIDYRRLKRIKLENRIAIINQNLINSRASGVAYSPSPVNPKEILVESSYGLCITTVEGRAVDIFRVLDTVTGDIKEDISNKKREMDVYDPVSKRIVTVKVPENKIRAASLTKDTVLEVAKLAKTIERAYSCPIDIEFCFEEQTNKLYVLQARPLTKSILAEESIKLPSIPQNRILARSRNIRNQGIFEGPAVVVRKVDHANRAFEIDGDLIEMNRRYSDGYVLISPEIPPQLEQWVTNAKAIYATECGTTGHAASIACEKGIIYLGRGIDTLPDILEIVRSGMKIGLAVSKEEGLVYLAN